VFGWNMHILGREMGDYILAGTTEVDQNMMIKEPGRINGGFFPKKVDSLQHPSVVIAVDNIKESMKNLGEAGGKVKDQPVDIPGIGQYASFIDTEGNVVGILQPVKK
jgi:uncharacterized protein